MEAVLNNILRGNTMKQLLMLLLLIGIVGCGSDAQKALDDNTAARNANTEAIQAKNKTNQSSGDNEKPLLEDERPAGKKALPKNDLSAALSGKRLHFKIDGESIWWDFYSDGTCCAGMGEERAKGQWSTSGNRLKTWAPIYEGGPVDDDYLVFADLTARAGSEVIGVNSAGQAESEGVKGMIVRVEPIPPASDTTDPTPAGDK